MERKDQIEKELGFSITWRPSNKRAQWIDFNYNGDLTKNKNFSEKDWPRPLKSWGDSSDPDGGLLEEDLSIMAKFYEEFAPKFEATMRKHFIEISKL